MKVGYVGDSWTHGWGIDDKEKTWPYLVSSFFNSKPIVEGGHGFSNHQILNDSLRLLNQEPDLNVVFIGWSGISRTENNLSLSYSPSEDTLERRMWFSSHSLEDLFQTWKKQIDQVNLESFRKKIPVIHFSVFGDKLPYKADHLIEESFLEFLSFKQNSSLLYEIPIFEFDFLHEKNDVADEFLSRALDSNWKLACAERENLRPSFSFFPCGHPNEHGHKVWANFITNLINQKYFLT